MRAVTDEEMGLRYKNVLSFVAKITAVCFNVGKETGGERYVDALREELRRLGRETTRGAIRASGIPELQGVSNPDCQLLGRLFDAVDDSYGNFWNGYVENSPTAFEKKLETCVLAKPWAKAPELCELVETLAEGMCDALGADVSIRFLEFMSKGDEYCHYRIEKR